MIKKEITFEDFDGNEVTETHYFHLSKSDIITMDLEETADGGLAKKLTLIGESKDPKQIMGTFKEILARSYGVRDPENPTKFRKSGNVGEDFMTSLACDALLTELMLDGSAAATFVAGLFPKGLVSDDDLAKALTDAGLPDPVAAPATVVPSAVISPAEYDRQQEALTGLRTPKHSDGTFLPWAFREPTDKELIAMRKDQMVDVFHRRSTGWTPPSPDSSIED